MKIVVIVRTRDSELFINRFCQNYQWADLILIADGGSKDKTKELASIYPNVDIEDFTQKIYSPDGKTWRNPHGKHINFLRDWAESLYPEWIIFDDVDCVPNYKVKEDYEKLFETQKDFILLNRIYMLGKDRYFEKLTKPYGEWVGGLWAWRAGLGFRADESDPMVHAFNMKYESVAKTYLPPYCLLHYFYPSDEYMQKKLKFYRDVGEQLNAKDPREGGGRLFLLEDWMRE